MNSENADRILANHRDLWDKKPVLREIYTQYFTLITDACLPGNLLEIGGGSGNFKGFIPECISMDIVSLPWLDVIADAQNLPFKKASFQNIIMVDVLHHIEFPVTFFREAERIPRPGGRLIVIEPAITPVSGVVYHLFHREPVDKHQNPLLEKLSDPARKPFDANQAIPTLLFHRYRDNFEKQFPALKIIHLQYMDIIAYPLSGGFRPWALVPVWLIRPLLKIEQILIPLLGPLMAFRLYCVIQNTRTIADDET
jgi:SAM-dependent methyltransferase